MKISEIDREYGRLRMEEYRFGVFQQGRLSVLTEEEYVVWLKKIPK